MLPKQILVSAILAIALGGIFSPVFAEENAFKIQCGISHIPITERNHETGEAHLIVGGTKARPGSWPFVAWLKYKKVFHVCGAAILNSEWVLTAAHCVQNITEERPQTITVHAGGSNVIYEQDPQAIKVTADYITIYPGYIPSTLQYDVALIHLAVPLDFHKLHNVVPACLPKPGERLAPGSKVYLLGWGKVNEEKNYSINLKQVVMPVISDDRCAQIQRHRRVPAPDEKSFCVMNEKGGNSACQGDSGGPVLHFNGQAWVLHGIISNGPTVCEEPRAPTINGRVSDYLDWIHSVMHQKA